MSGSFALIRTGINAPAAKNERRCKIGRRSPSYGCIVGFLYSAVMSKKWLVSTSALVVAIFMANIDATQRGSSTAGPKQLIAHRGASGYAPEHTIAAYQMALEQKADFVEPDLAIS